MKLFRLSHIFVVALFLLASLAIFSSTPRSVDATDMYGGCSAPPDPESCSRSCMGDRDLCMQCCEIGLTLMGWPNQWYTMCRRMCRLTPETPIPLPQPTPTPEPTPTPTPEPSPEPTPETPDPNEPGLVYSY